MITPVVIADDSNMYITVTGARVDADGDFGYVLSIQNRTDKKAYVYSAKGWTLKGADVPDPVLLQEVGAGDTVDGFLWFDHEEFGSGTPDDFATAEGVIVAEDFNTSAQIGSYAFKL